ncbi:hypothetical protein [Labrys sp. ZIDIC5]|uniref:hypothetical protein n=1 Tax=Labrys sedimenti TaxID=3106036 RepID=UPI002ACA8D14|nr:hypothetical protein [Labrys sp. ZIDIC5]MDZ5448617.1 hypothetical protein [Labrys sp. ZIDIC5]
MSNVISLHPRSAPEPIEWPACETIDDAFVVAMLAFMDCLAETEHQAALEGLYVQRPASLPPLSQIQLGGHAMTLDQVFAAGGTIKKPLPVVALALFHLWRKLMRSDGLPPIATYSEAADFLLKSASSLKNREAENAPA